MKLHKILVLALVAAYSLTAASVTEKFSALSKVEAERAAAIYNGPRSRVSMWIWSDKYTYQPGEAATFKATIKTNGDLYPYTFVVYRQNNQTGAKTYMTATGSASAEPTDFGGNKLSDGFQAARLADLTKQTVLALPIPEEYGMHTAVVELRDYTGTRILKSAYMKLGVVRATTVLSGDITADRTLTSDTRWEVRGVVNVRNNATLTIEPGTFVIGQPGSSPPSVLLVTRDGKINASGTKSRPIIMTSSQPFGQRKRGDWGGLIMLGKAPINVPANAAGGTNTAGTFFIEGLVANDNFLYGGSDANHNCGTLRYVRVEYAGTILSPNNETNSFTWGGCGKGTVAEHLQAIYGADDSFEWFGGTMDAKWLVGGLGADDYVDFQLGWTGRLQYGLFYQNADARGNRGMEGDNSEFSPTATPFSNPTMYNLTFIGSGSPGFDESNAPGIFLRRGARGTFNNMVVSNFFSGAVDISDAATQAEATAGNVKMNGILMWKNNLGGVAPSAPADTRDGNITSAFTRTYAGSNTNAAQLMVQDPLFVRPFEWSDPDWSGQFGSPLFRAGWVAAPDDGFFDQTAKFIGGIGDDDWTLEWTSWLVEGDIAP